MLQSPLPLVDWPQLPSAINVSDQPFFWQDELSGSCQGRKSGDRTDVVSYVREEAPESRASQGKQQGSRGVSALLPPSLLGQKCHQAAFAQSCCQEERTRPGVPLHVSSPGRVTAVAGCFFFFFTLFTKSFPEHLLLS